MVIEYTPHAAQMEIHKARGARFRTVCTGRRFGKTLCMAAELLDRGGGEAGGDYAWVAPTYGVAERGVEAFRTIAPEFARIIGRMPTRAEFEGAAGPCRVWFLSADAAGNCRITIVQRAQAENAIFKLIRCGQSALLGVSFLENCHVHSSESLVLMGCD